MTLDTLDSLQTHSCSSETNVRPLVGTVAVIIIPVSWSILSGKLGGN